MKPHLYVEPFNNYLKTIYYDKKQIKMQGYIAAELKYRCRIGLVDLNSRIVYKSFGFAIKRKRFKASRLITGKVLKPFQIIIHAAEIQEKSMKELNGQQKKYLKGLAHNLKPVVLIGQSGLPGPVIKAIDEALTTHELIKIKFNAHKEKESKKDMAVTIENSTHSQIVRIVGHTIIFFRQNIDPEKQKIHLPTRSDND